MRASMTLAVLTFLATVWISAVGRTAIVRAGDGPAARPPARLSETGLYSDIAAGRIDPANRPYSPQYPLWSDGASKSRWVYLPPGSTIDARNTDGWVFPDGTKFWKEFAFGGRRVETRLLWKVGDEAWIFATYVWNEAQTEADLAPETGLPRHVEIAPGKRHSIPAVLDCRACHDSRRTEVLGFTALQLSTDRDPGAPHAEPLSPDMVTLRTLVDEGRLSPARRDLVERPPRIAADEPRTRSVLGYLAANCGSCHSTTSPIAPLGLHLQHVSGPTDPRSAAALKTTVDVESRYAIPDSVPGTTRRLAPGAPELSALLHRMRSRRPSSQMPPLGTVLPDEEAIALVTRWIAEDLPRLFAASAAATSPLGADPADRRLPRDTVQITRSRASRAR